MSRETTDAHYKRLLSYISPYCQCEYHQMHWLNPLRCCVCRCCVGCLTSEFPSTEVMTRTMVYIRQKESVDTVLNLLDMLQSKIDFSNKSIG